jgi:hypothetical protein
LANIKVKNSDDGVRKLGIGVRKFVADARDKCAPGRCRSVGACSGNAEFV